MPDIERPTPCNYVAAPPLPLSASLPPSLPLLPVSSMPPALVFSASSFPPQIHQGEVPDIERPTPCNYLVAPHLQPSIAALSPAPSPIHHKHLPFFFSAHLVGVHPRTDVALHILSHTSHIDPSTDSPFQSISEFDVPSELL